MAFIPRTSFAYPLRTPSWYAGHMVRSLRILPELLADVDLLIEARDARLPLSGANGVWESVVERGWGLGAGSGCGYGYGGPSRHGGHDGDETDGPAVPDAVDRKGKRRERIVVFTKRDLAEARYEEPLRKAFWKHAGQRVLFADTRADADARAVLAQAVRLARDNGAALSDLRVLVVGMPNVGKSSLLNALRRAGVQKGKAFITGAEPGITRRLTGTVKVHDNPAVYVYDTPGIMVPYLGHGDAGAERGLKLALTAGIKSSLFEQDVVADYLLYKLNLRLAADESLAPHDLSRHKPYTSTLPLPAMARPTNSLAHLVAALAARLGALRAGAEPDTDAAAAWLVGRWRDGRLGRWTLDDLDGAETDVARRLEGAGARPTIEAESEMDAAMFDFDSEAEGAVVDRSEGAVNKTEMVTTEADTSAMLEPSRAAPEGPAGPTSLEDKVDAAVVAHLEAMRAERDDVEQGRNRSKSQVRKAEVRARAEAARAKQKAKARR
ncbi:Mitochondrial GTPase 1 [Cryptotrichosporon argae]